MHEKITYHMHILYMHSLTLTHIHQLPARQQTTLLAGLIIMASNEMWFPHLAFLFSWCTDKTLFSLHYYLIH